MFMFCEEQDIEENHKWWHNDDADNNQTYSILKVRRLPLQPFGLYVIDKNFVKNGFFTEKCKQVD